MSSFLILLVVAGQLTFGEATFNSFTACQKAHAAMQANGAVVTACTTTI